MDTPLVLHVCASDADRAWVNGYLVPALGVPPEQIHTRDKDRLGYPRVTEIADAISRAGFTLLILSEAFLADDWSEYATALASHAAVASGQLLLLARERCDLPLHLDFRVRLECFDGEERSWDAAMKRLRDLLQSAERPAEEPTCPYPGMAPYDPRQQQVFFGRDREIEELSQRLVKQVPGANGGCLLFLIGPSGCGKSSLLQAGLLPRLLRGGPDRPWPGFVVQTVRPGAHPTSELARALGQHVDQRLGDAVSSLLGAVDDRRVLLLIDPFEEVFTATTDDEGEEFLRQLRELRAEPRCSVLAVMRADFYPQLMASPLWPIGSEQRIELGSLRDEELRAAIRRPAEARGVHVEPMLLERLAQDAGRGVGVLPLLQETLVLLWERRRERGEQRLLTLASYEALQRPEEDGGRRGSALQVALSRHADAVMSDLPEHGEAVARRIFLRLVRLGEGGLDTRRQQPEEALRVPDEDRALCDDVLQRLTEGRLITLSAENTENSVRLVDVSHEALLTGWSTMQRWLDELRQGEQRRRRLEGKVAEWQALRGLGGLLDREELPEFEQWLASEVAADLGRDPAMVELVQNSKRALMRRRRTLYGAVALLGVFAVTVSVLALVARLNAKDARAQHAEALMQHGLRGRLLAEASNSYQEMGRKELVENIRPLLSLPYLVAAREAIEASGGTPNSALRMLFAQATTGLPITRPLEHRGHVVSVAFSIDGKKLVTASADGTAQIWDVATGKPIAPPMMHHDTVNRAAFSPDGTRVVTASWDHTAQVWDAATAKPISPRLQHAEAVNEATFSPDGNYVLTASSDKTAQVWDAATGRPVAPPLRHLGAVNSAAFSPDGIRVVTASADHTALVWDAMTGRRLSRPLQHGAAVASAAFSADGARVVTSSWDHTARVWNAATAEPACPPFEHKDVVDLAAFSPDGRRVVTASWDNTARVWDVVSGSPLSPSLVHKDRVIGAAFSPDGDRIVTASWDRTARIWDAQTGQPLSFSFAHESRLTAAVFSRDGSRVATASEDKTARVWDGTFTKASALLLKHRASVKMAAFSPDGRLVVTASLDNTARVWDAASGQPVSLPVLHRDAVNSAAFSPDGTRIVTASSDNTARVWNATTGAPVTPWLNHTGAVVHSAFSPDGRRVVTSSSDGTARVWDATTGTLLMPPLLHGSAAAGIRNYVVTAVFSPDGERVLTASADQTARLWDAVSGKSVLTPLEHHGRLASAAFSADGKQVVTAGWDHSARIWDAASGAPRSGALQHNDRVVAASFSPDGMRIATASSDARVWDAKTGTLHCVVLHPGQVHGVAFSPDNARIVTASADTTARVSDAATCQPLGPALVHPSGVGGAAFSPDGGRVVTWSDDGIARVWNLPLAQGPLEQWREVSEQAASYRLVDGVLVRSLSSAGQAAAARLP